MLKTLKKAGPLFLIYHHASAEIKLSLLESEPNGDNTGVQGYLTVTFPKLDGSVLNYAINRGKKRTARKYDDFICQKLGYEKAGLSPNYHKGSFLIGKSLPDDADDTLKYNFKESSACRGFYMDLIGHPNAPDSLDAMDMTALQACLVPINPPRRKPKPSKFIECINPQCTCPNGAPSEGDDCAGAGINDCQACDSGFYLDSWQVGAAIGTNTYRKDAGTVETYKDCIDLVKSQEPTANGASIESGGFDQGASATCYAEFNMSDVDISDSTRETFIFAHQDIPNDWWQMGDGTGGSDLLLGYTTTQQECIDLVKSQEPTANGALITTGFICNAEFGMTTIDSGDTNYVSLKFDDITNPGPYDEDNLIPTSLWQDGDGISINGDDDTYVGYANSWQDCVNLVQTEQPTANGASVSPGVKCWAEFGMTGVDSSTNYKSISFDSIKKKGTWQAGAAIGTGSYRKDLGTTASYQDCIDLVVNDETDANGASIAAGGFDNGASANCYAEFNMLDVEISDSSRETFMFGDNPEVSTSLWQMGDGVGSSDLLLGHTETHQECIDLVKTQEPTANGALATAGYICNAEFGMTTVDSGDTGYVSLIFDDIPTNINAPYDENNLIPTSLWQTGDGISINGDDDTYVGYVNSWQECVNLVQAEQPTANGASVSPGIKCYAEFGMTGLDSSSNYKSILFDWIEEEEASCIVNEGI